ncbi:hypothetical protein [Streptomyces sp. NPDC058373]|uniref:hypothetical protein n=1 Tax=Streptomyces sp. NPDC058373 TaxID=3346465 RepID=UPI00365A9B85
MTEPRPADNLRDRIAEAIADATGNSWPAQAFLVEADAVMAVLPAPVDRILDEQATAREERPLSPYYEHPACGFRWHGRDGMDIPMRDGQPVCPRCELAKAEVYWPSVDRAAVLREAADRLARQADELWAPGRTAHTTMHADADELRRVAAETETGGAR